jgi:tRNA (adenine22-N1)-methyltransferase
MDISIRLRNIAALIDKCNCAADIGSDHGYLPVFLIKNDVCQKAIASDINKGPVERTRINVRLNDCEDRIDCRQGAGLRTIKPYEAECAVIAGMGGNLIRDIIEESPEVFRSLQYAVLQPVQNSEVLRKHIYEKGYRILEEELCIDENKFYEIIKVKYDNIEIKVDEIYYEVSSMLVEKKHPFMKDFINLKINKYMKISNSIIEDTLLAEKRKLEIRDKIFKLKELVKCL